MATPSDPPPIARAPTGVSGLDHILHGGLPLHRLYLVQGDPGMGKTTLAIQFLLEGVRLDEPCLYVTLSENREELLEIARSHHWNLDAISILELSSFTEQLAIDSENTLFHPADVELQDVTKILFDEVERTKPSRVVFDSLSELRLLSQSALRYRRQILGIKQHMAGRHCTTLFLDDLTATNSNDDRQIESLAHGVICMQRKESEYGPDCRRISVRKLRGSKFDGGQHNYRIETGGLIVYPRVVAAGHCREFERESVSSDVPGIDELLGGGLDRGTSNLFLGPAGAGKSSLAISYAHAMASRGEHVALFVFDEILPLYLRKATAFGMDLEPFIASGVVHAQQVDPADLSPGEFACRLVKSVETENARLIVIDSLNGYSKAMQGEDILGVQLHELLSYLNQQGVVTILVLAQAGYMGAMQSFVDVTYLADTVIVLRHFEALGSVRQAISVAKKRSGHHERTIRELQVTQQGIRVGEPLRQFRGVLTGVPTFVGSAEDMMAEVSKPSASHDDGR